MGQDSKIEWTDHTFNIVWGCTNVSEGCRNCYAHTLSTRYGYDVWGKHNGRRRLSDSYWEAPLRWNTAAQQHGQRSRVFCSSMADVFEDHPDNNAERPRLWELIVVTPWLDWLLLTKRPENISAMLPFGWHTNGWPNVWLGTSIEDERVLHRVAALTQVPARVHFLSIEPLLGPLPGLSLDHVEGVIVGGESGRAARPLNPDWVRPIRDLCVAQGVPFHFKQWGEWLPYEMDAQPPFWNDQAGGFHDGHGLDILDPETGEIGTGWHPDSEHGDAAWRRVGKKAAGRLLDGRTWDEMPAAAQPD